MTPREPDRYEAKARALLEAHDLNRGTIAAALRAEAADALERAAQEYDKLGDASTRCHLVARALRALASPAAAPAADQDEVATFGAFGHGEPAAPAPEPIHYVIANEPVGFLFCGPTVWESSRTDRVATNRKLVTCPNCLAKLAARTSKRGTGEGT